MRSRVLRVDTPTPCHAPENRDIFEAIIDMTVASSKKPEKRTRLKKAVEAAQGICGNCPERKQCLDVHGPDTKLGVIAGATDKQRAKVFGASA